MKIAILSDTHVHPWAEFDKDGDRLLDCVNVWRTVRRYCKKHNITTVLFGGDLFHKRGVVHTHAFNLLVDQLVSFRDAGIAVYSIDGNHDHADRVGAVHALQSLHQAGLVRGVHEHDGWHVWHLDDCDVFGFSYRDSRVDFERCVAEALELKSKAHTIALFHHGFKGASVGSSLEYQVREEIDASLLSGVFDYVFSGHYHTRQPILGLDKATYIGSPLEFTRSDRVGDLREKKGFLIYDTSRSDWKLVPIRSSRFISLDESDLEDLGWEAMVENNFVDFIYENVDAQEVEERLWKAGARGVHCIPYTKPKKSKARLRLRPGLSEREVLKKYLSYRKDDIKASKLTREELLRIGTSLINKTYRR